MLLKSGAGDGSDTWSLPEALTAPGIAGGLGWVAAMEGYVRLLPYLDALKV